MENSAVKFMCRDNFFLKFIDENREIENFNQLAKDLHNNGYLFYSEIFTLKDNWKFLFGFGKIEDFHKLFCYNKTVYGFSAEEDNYTDLSIVENSNDAFWQFELAYGIGSKYGIGILTTKDIDFIYHYDNQYDFFLLYGKIDFLENIINCKIDEYTQIYNNDFEQDEKSGFMARQNQIFNYLKAKSKNKDYDSNKKIFNKYLKDFK